ncbi:winged helix DNA-binding protein [Planococcus sp. N028]|uniref:Winged helix DNA-binding protein n=1 Tax=Planococcus shixiaomingii TaxID=3058393 RepID=A0ABT8N5U1_9BACL|nr:MULTISPECIES: MarR family transcriptional regulator [unclassified Planococcus (in: firmicutes)]MDN7243256.1 winged helix DNA-binding protein [Planococcus sp. N028]WKA55198.1 winged helix DNA-binding protein [Planococcus sp. N022]
MDDRLKEAVDLFQEVMFFGTERVIRAVDNPLWTEFSPEQIQTLKLISTESHITSSRLALLQSVHKSAISSRIKKLLQKDLIRIVQTEDRREKMLELTDAGKEVLEQSDKVLTDYLEKLLSEQINDEEIEQFLTFFRKLKNIIKTDGV